MSISLREVAELVGGHLLDPARDGSVAISGVSAINEGQPGTITFCAAERYQELISSTAASAVLVNEQLAGALGDAARARPLVVCKIADYAFALVAEKLLADYPPRDPGVHPTAVVHPDAIIGDGVHVAAYAVVDAHASVGDGCVLEAFSYVGYKARLGKNCHLYQHSIVREHCHLGNGVILQPGAIIGSDGFGYVPVNGRVERIPQLGNVIVRDGAEIGANTTVDRARFRHTIIGPMVKLDNLVQIAHNCEVGAGTMMAAQVGLAGTTVIGAGCLVGGQAGFSGHVTVTDNVRIGARAAVVKDVDVAGDYLGEPAVSGHEYKRYLAARRKLPDLIKRVKELETRLAQIEKRGEPGA
ncbi:MAG: UDP-3-O-(3-hydroxymyristoyl)glucosamine N-acyltransferase [Planctomycetota bacterium]